MCGTPRAPGQLPPREVKKSGGTGKNCEREDSVGGIDRNQEEPVQIIGSEWAVGSEGWSTFWLDGTVVNVDRDLRPLDFATVGEWGEEKAVDALGNSNRAVILALSCEIDKVEAQDIRHAMGG